MQLLHRPAGRAMNRWTGMNLGPPACTLQLGVATAACVSAAPGLRAALGIGTAFYMGILCTEAVLIEKSIQL